MSRPPAAATTAITAKTVAVPLTPRITPAAAGARQMPALSIQDETTLAAVELLGAPRQAGHQRRLGRTRERDRGRRRGGQRVDEERRSLR